MGGTNADAIGAIESGVKPNRRAETVASSRVSSNRKYNVELQKYRTIEERQKAATRESTNKRQEARSCSLKYRLHCTGALAFACTLSSSTHTLALASNKCDLFHLLVSNALESEVALDMYCTSNTLED